VTFVDEADRRLYLESVPQRITPTPHTLDGPTARWLEAQSELAPVYLLPTQESA
jgi:hypothetical protein